MKQVLFAIGLVGAAHAISYATPIKVSTGLNTTCEITDAGALLCWGNNSSGQLGQGFTGADQLTPLAVPGMGSGVTDVSVAIDDGNVCAVMSGAAYCWGPNTHGQVGDGTTTPRFSPTAVSALTSGVVKVSTGGETTCAIVGANLAYYCWGSDTDGQLADNYSGDSYVPMQMPRSGSPYLDTVDISVNGGSSCYIKHYIAGENGPLAHNVLHCFGHNNKGQLGFDPTTTPNIQLPLTPIMYGNDGFTTKVANPTAVSLGLDHMCAAADNGNIYCYGNNSSGELGDGFFADKFSPPAMVLGGGGYTAVSAGGAHTCALTSSGGYCWGAGDHGQLDSYPVATRATPASMPAGHLPATSITAGAEATCFIHSGAVVCVGANDSGQLGDGTQQDGWDPYTPPTITGLLTSAGNAHSCAIGKYQNPGALYCWGDNSHGEVGNGTSGSAVAVPTLVSGMTSGVTDVSASMDSIGGYTTCAIRSGVAYCWGKNDTGQVGNGLTGSDVTSPYAITFPVGTGVAKRISTAGDHTCALVEGPSSGWGLQLYCWGSNAYGQLGVGSTGGNYITPQLVGGLDARVVDISANTQYTCAIQNPETGSSNYLYCWGKDDYQQLGSGQPVNTNTNAPGTTIMSPTAIHNPTMISAGWGHACALTTSNGAYCWGNNANGQIGDNTTTQRAVPTAVSGSSSFTQISAGGDHTLAVQSTGSAGTYTWGWNGDCQLGLGGVTRVTRNGTTISCLPALGGPGDKHVPTLAHSPGNSSPAAGGYHSLEYYQLSIGPEVYSVGNSSSEQLGNGSATMTYYFGNTTDPSPNW